MQENAGTEPVSKVKHENKAVDISSLTLGQRQLLKGGLKDAFMHNSKFNHLGNQHKAIFHDTCNMMLNDKSLNMLNVAGEEFWKAVEVPNQKKKEQQRFIKFVFGFVIPGTSNRLEVEKVWKYEDFTP